MRSTPAWLGLPFPALILVVIPACTEGDRALTGKCPTGETCSQRTPSGLLFEGNEQTGILFDFEAVPITAVGGVQTVALTDVATRAPLAVPWRAELAGALAVDRVETSRVVVRGTGAGEAKLRIVDRSTGALFDRFTLRAAPIATLSLVEAGELVERTEPRPVVWFAGVEIDAAIALVDAEGARLVDEAVRVTLADDGPAALERLGWDHVVVRGAPVGPLALTISAGTLVDQRVTTTVVDAIDAVVPGATSDPAEVGRTLLYCFEGRHGESAVLGLSWAFTTTGVAVKQHDWPTPNCVMVEPTAAGRLTVSATAIGKSAEVVVEVAPKRASLRGASLADRTTLAE